MFPFLSVADGIFIDNYIHSFVDDAVSFVLSGGMMYVGTPDGIAYTPLTNPNPSAPDLWNTLYHNIRLAVNNINEMILVQETLIACTGNGIASLNGDAGWRFPGPPV